MSILNNVIDLQKFFEKVHTSSSLLILDYDGTLAPFVQNRMQAYPYPGIKERLLALKNSKRVRMVIVSGRRLSDLEILLNELPELELWGSHGLERKLPNGKKLIDQLDSRVLEAIQEGKNACQKLIEPELCEVKPFGIAVHWRGLLPSQAWQIQAAIQACWQGLTLNNALEIHHFDGGLELRPKDKNKGYAVRKLLNEVPKGTAIAYLGDDATDEQAFAALGDRGLKVLVREQLRPTLANIHLIPPKELLAFLDQWRTSNE